MRSSIGVLLSFTLATTLSLAAPSETTSTAPVQAGPQRMAAMISGGHETDPRDHGRPVVLVAGGLGVTPDVFRNAFSRVHPADPGSLPDKDRVQQNKDVLLAALARYGVNNELLDSVSDHYRYQPGSGRLWPTKPASIIALVNNGEVISFEVTDGGSGYTSTPTITVPGAKCPPVAVSLNYGKDLGSNGSIGSVTIR